MTRMKALRLELGISQQALGYRAGMQAGEVSKIERKRLVPSARQIRRIARVLKVHEAELLTEVDNYDAVAAAR